ncbi:hypothetical protein J6590_050031 [Homalodisca vitripennis]|nr:hypothetical protein J6590_050031 [Homalodisca vitripennis]
MQNFKCLGTVQARDVLRSDRQSYRKEILHSIAKKGCGSLLSDRFQYGATLSVFGEALSYLPTDAVTQFRIYCPVWFFSTIQPTSLRCQIIERDLSKENYLSPMLRTVNAGFGGAFAHS